VTPSPPRDVLSPREVAVRAGFSYHAILRAIRRGDLKASEPIPGHYRVSLMDYDRWLHTPVHMRDRDRIDEPPQQQHRRPRTANSSEPGSPLRLKAIEAGG